MRLFQLRSYDWCIHLVYVVLGEFQWQWKVCVCVLAPHMSFLNEVLKAEICMMGVHSSWMDERYGHGGGEWDVVGYEGKDD
jgi:hypothetical protein